MLWEEEIPGGAHWSAAIRRGVVLRLQALGDGANVAALFYSREQPIERYNMADTLKAQHTAHLTTGCVCYSDMGRILCSITADTCGWHDPLCGLTDAAQIAALYGATSFQKERNARYVSGRDAMLVELGKYGLGERDLVANINFFSKVAVDDAGEMHLIAGHAMAGQFVDLRFEMDTIVALHAGPHPLARPQSNGRYAPPAIRLQARRGAPAAADDRCRMRCPENERGFINTERVYST
jgi:urea carboxylase-associated protein 2